MYAAISPSETEAVLPPTLRDRDLQRADGAARVAVRGEGGRTVIADLYQRAPGKVLFPLIDGEACREAVFLNTAGGVAGGDRLRYEAQGQGGASLVVTTQAAERVYRAIDAPGRVETRIEARGAASVEWLPQETILFDGGRLSRATEIHVDAGSTVLAMDWLILGRMASGERVGQGEVRDNWRVYRDGRLAWADAFRFGGDIAALAAKKPLLAGCTAIATVLYAADDAPARLDDAREALSGAQCHAGATVVNGLLIARLAAGEAGELRRAVERFLLAFRGRGLPKVWAC